MKPVRIGICGLGTVASGVIELLVRNGESIARRLGTTVDIVHIGARRDNPKCDTSAFTVTRDIFDVVHNPDVDILVELIGGTTTAKDLVLGALQANKHVVTANKALIAEYGDTLVHQAHKSRSMLNFEAAVAGGIPVVETIKASLAGNEINQVVGIINGTSNYILTAMAASGLSFHNALQEAQTKGYAEADPTFDIEGFDAAHKICILASLCFGIPLDFNKVYCEGITAINGDDIVFADDLGYCIKHIAIARKTRLNDSWQYDIRVHPALLPKKLLLSQVNGVLNAVEIVAEPLGKILLSGEGAGAGATASAVVADIINIARVAQLDNSLRPPITGFQHDTIRPCQSQSIEEIVCEYYLRLEAFDEPGVMAKVSQIFADENISIEAIIQKQKRKVADNNVVPIVLLTHKVEEYRVARTVPRLEQLSVIKGRVQKIRIADIEEEIAD